MVPKPTSIAEAYSVLGLEEGSSLDQVKSSYKQLALRTHPDKNPDNPDATAEFQSVSEAYNVLSKHFERAARGPGHGPRGFGGGYGFPFRGQPFSFGYGGGNMDDIDDEDEYEDYDSDDEFEDDSRVPFFMFLFEEFMRGHSRRQAHSHFYRPRRPSPDPETPEQYQARIKRSHEEQAAAAERRAQEAAQRKARQERDRENERRQAEQRQKAKVEAKKAEAEAARLKAEKAVRNLQQRGQTLRSATFAAARAGDTAGVKKSVWEDEVDAAGGEIKVGCQEYAKTPKDPKETLLHIAARNGDVELVEWLDAHGADMEERNSQEFTALHVALQHGHSNIVKHIFDSYPPKESDSKKIYSLPPSKSLLSLAVASREPEVVWMILETKGLATSQEIGNAWTKVSSTEIKATKPGQKKPSPDDEEKFNDIRNLLMRYGGFTPPPTPKVGAQNDSQWKAEERGLNSNAKGGRPDQAAAEPSELRQQQPKPKSKQKQKQKKKEVAEKNFDQPRPPLGQLPSQSQPPNRLPEQQEQQQQRPKMSRRGRGAGRGRGHGRGRGRGKATV